MKCLMFIPVGCLHTSKTSLALGCSVPNALNSPPKSTKLMKQPSYLYSPNTPLSLSYSQLVSSPSQLLSPLKLYYPPLQLPGISFFSLKLSLQISLTAALQNPSHSCLSLLPCSCLPPSPTCRPPSKYLLNGQKKDPCSWQNGLQLLQIPWTRVIFSLAS